MLKVFKFGGASIKDVANIIKEINEIIIDDPPISISKGRYINKGFSRELDEYRDIADNGAKWLLEYQNEQKIKTGISSLKIGFNKVFGYYIDVTKVHKDKVPENYIRKQTLTNSERFFTDELKKYEDLLNSSKNIFVDILNFFNKYAMIDIDEDKVKNVIKSTEFNKLKEYEQKYGFKESAAMSDQSKSIFNLGPNNDWKKLLDKKISEKICEYFKSEMKELGYIT